tara:strand:+ start:72 stop:434 length:363 start_codon:yes stop_codon:yes gene_type:complete
MCLYKPNILNYYSQDSNYMGFDTVESDWTYDFRNINMQDSDEKGVCYSQTKQVWITLHLHESFNDIIDTIIHESLHNAICLDLWKVEKRSMDESLIMEIEQEHELIKRISWVLNDWVDLE